MLTLSIKELFAILLNFVGTTIVNIHAVTPHNGFFRSGLNGSRKTVDKMINVIGIDPANIVKEQTKSFLLTSCGWDKINENALLKAVMPKLAIWNDLSESEQEGILNQLHADKGLNGTEMTTSEAWETIGSYELSARKNGTTINGYLATSAKDDMPMITVYAVVKSKVDYRYINTATNEIIDLKDPKIIPFINPNYGKVSSKQIAFGHTEESAPATNNFRLDRIIDIKLNGTRYQVIAG